MEPVNLKKQRIFNYMAEEAVANAAQNTADKSGQACASISAEPTATESTEKIRPPNMSFPMRADYMADEIGPTTAESSTETIPPTTTESTTSSIAPTTAKIPAETTEPRSEGTTIVSTADISLHKKHLASTANNVSDETDINTTKTTAPAIAATASEATEGTTVQSPAETTAEKRAESTAEKTKDATAKTSPPKKGSTVDNMADETSETTVSRTLQASPPTAEITVPSTGEATADDAAPTTAEITATITWETTASINAKTTAATAVEMTELTAGETAINATKPTATEMTAPTTTESTSPTTEPPTTTESTKTTTAEITVAKPTRKPPKKSFTQAATTAKETTETAPPQRGFSLAPHLAQPSNKTVSDKPNNCHRAPVYRNTAMGGLALALGLIPKDIKPNVSKASTSKAFAHNPQCSAAKNTLQEPISLATAFKYPAQFISLTNHERKIYKIRQLVAEKLRIMRRDKMILVKSPKPHPQESEICFTVLEVNNSDDIIKDDGTSRLSKAIIEDPELFRTECSELCNLIFRKLNKGSLSRLLIENKPSANHTFDIALSMVNAMKENLAHAKQLERALIKKVMLYRRSIKWGKDFSSQPIRFHRELYLEFADQDSSNGAMEVCFDLERRQQKSSELFDTIFKKLSMESKKRKLSKLSIKYLPKTKKMEAAEKLREEEKRRDLKKRKPISHSYTPLSQLPPIEAEYAELPCKNFLRFTLWIWPTGYCTRRLVPQTVKNEKLAKQAPRRTNTRNRVQCSNKIHDFVLFIADTKSDIHDKSLLKYHQERAELLRMLMSNKIEPKSK